jgi:hypothetical protein
LRNNKITTQQKKLVSDVLLAIRNVIVLLLKHIIYIDNFNRKFIIDGFSNLDGKMVELANKNCRVMLSTSAGLKCAKGVCK